LHVRFLQVDWCFYGHDTRRRRNVTIVQPGVRSP
jgi:hypothetical protein